MGLVKKMGTLKAEGHPVQRMGLAAIILILFLSATGTLAQDRPSTGGECSLAGESCHYRHYAHRLSVKSQGLITQLEAFFKEVKRPGDFAFLNKDHQSKAWQEYAGLIEESYKRPGEFEVEKAKEVVPLLNILGKGLQEASLQQMLKQNRPFRLQEEEYNHLSQKERFYFLRSLQQAYQQELAGKKEGNRLLREYFQLAYRHHTKAMEFLKQNPSPHFPFGLDQTGLDNLFSSQPEMASLFFVRNKREPANQGNVGNIWDYRPRFELFDPVSLQFASLDVLQDILQRYHSFSLYRIKGRRVKEGPVPGTQELEVKVHISNGRQVSDLGGKLDGGDGKAEVSESRMLKRIVRRALAAYHQRNFLLGTQGGAVRRVLNLKLFQSLKEKYIPQAGEKDEVIFTIKETNSAEQGRNIINIIRKEEMMKTLVHEIYHFIGLEEIWIHESITQAAQLNFAIERRDSGGRPLAFEALTEAMALVSHIAMSAFEILDEELALIREGDRKSQTLHLQNELWRVEKAFSLFQAAKILHLSGFSSVIEFLSPQRHQRRVRETTSAAEYFILKAALIYDLEGFLRLMIRQGDKNHPAPILSREEQRVKLLDLMLGNARGLAFQRDIDLLISRLRKLKSQGAAEFFRSDLYLTQRMSLIEPAF